MGYEKSFDNKKIKRGLKIETEGSIVRVIGRKDKVTRPFLVSPFLKVVEVG